MRVNTKLPTHPHAYKHAHTRARTHAHTHTRTYFRDLKSGNVLISNNLRAKIADFGTLDHANQQQNRPSSIDAEVDLKPKGTLEYMAPECLRGEEQGAKADVFSFGVLFWEILHEKDPELLAQEGVDVHVTQRQASCERLLCEEGKRLLFAQG